MGSASDLAKTHADAVLTNGQLSVIIDGLLLAKKTHRIIIQNICWAFGYNMLALPLAAFGLIPPYAAAIGMSLSSLIVVCNALRLSKSPVISETTSSSAIKEHCKRSAWKYFLFYSAFRCLSFLVHIAFFFWNVNNGQYDDLESPAHKILFDDDDDLIPTNIKSTQSTDSAQNKQDNA